MFDALLDEGSGLDLEAYWGAGFLPGRYLPAGDRSRCRLTMRAVFERRHAGGRIEAVSHRFWPAAHLS